MKRKITLLSLFYLLLFVLMACQSKSVAEVQVPNISITCEGKEILGIGEPRKWNGIEYEVKDSFSHLLVDKTIDNLSYITPDKKIEFQFDTDMPSKVIVYDYVLNGEGKERYNIEPVEKAVELMDNNSYSFTLGVNYASMLSSYLGDYEKGSSIRGIEIRCFWEDDECIYRFAVRSDADNISDNAVYITPVKEIDLSNLNLYCQTEIDNFKNNENAILSIYVNAKKEDNGKWSFDDRNEWMVVLEHNEKYYPLIERQFLQIGVVSYDVFKTYEDDSEVLHIVTRLTQTASYSIYDFTYLDEGDEFAKTPLCEYKDINFLSDSNQLN